MMMPVSASHCGGCGGLRRGNHASLAGDAAIMLDAAVALEIEYRLLAENRRVEIAVRGDELVALGCRLRDDLAVWVDEMRDTTICLLSAFWDEEALCDRTATAIADGKVVGWFWAAWTQRARHLPLCTGKPFPPGKDIA